MKILIVFYSLLYCCLAEVYVVSPSNSSIFTIIQNLHPGDQLILTAGTFIFDQKVSFWLNGTAEAPIIIQGESGQHVVVVQEANQNIMDFQGTNFILKNIEFTGGSKGLRLGETGNVSNALFENLTIHDTQETAFSMNQNGLDYNNITIRYLEVYNTGEGTSECFYLGCNYDACTFRNSIVEFNYCHNTTLAESGFGSGIQVKTGSYNNIIRNNVIFNTGGVGLLLYDSYDLGNNIVDSNLVINAGNIGIQLSAGIVVTNNIIINSYYSGIGGSTTDTYNSLPPRNILIAQNTVLHSQTDYCLRGNSWENTYANTIIIANNVFFCSEAEGSFMIFGDYSEGTPIWVNNAYIGGSSPEGANSTGAFLISNSSSQLINPKNYNEYPKSESSLINAGSGYYTTAGDFNCLPRNQKTPTIGAYEYIQPTNPGFIFQNENGQFKYCVGNTSSSTTGSSTGLSTGSSSGLSTGSSSGFSTGAAYIGNQPDIAFFSFWAEGECCVKEMKVVRVLFGLFCILSLIHAVRIRHRR